MHIRVKGKRSKIRFIPVNPAAQRMIEDYLALTGHRSDVEGALFRPVKNNRTGRLDRHLDPASLYQNIVRKSAQACERLNESEKWPGNRPQRRGYGPMCAFAACHGSNNRSFT